MCRRMKISMFPIFYFLNSVYLCLFILRFLLTNDFLTNTMLTTSQWQREYLTSILLTKGGFVLTVWREEYCFQFRIIKSSLQLATEYWIESPSDKYLSLCHLTNDNRKDRFLKHACKQRWTLLNWGIPRDIFKTISIVSTFLTSQNLLINYII